jgi:hypothetical protein
VRPVSQTKCGSEDVPPEERGDCLPACLATLLHVGIEDVAVPYSDDEHWWDATQRALEPHGYHLVVADAECWPWGFWIAAVPSLNLVKVDGTPLPHVVVMKGHQLVWDPAIRKRYEPLTPIEDLQILRAYVLVPFEQRSAR